MFGGDWALPQRGQAFYYIGSPVFRHVSIDLGSGRNFIIDAPESSEANRYVQRAELNGKPLNRAWLTHAKSFPADAFCCKWTGSFEMGRGRAGPIGL